MAIGGTLAVGGTAPIGGLGSGGEITPVAGSAAIGGTDSVGGTAAIGGTGAANSAGSTFACGEQGLECETGKSYCSDYLACVLLPASCFNQATTCACYESIYGAAQMMPGGWSCTDVGPGAAVITTIPT